MIDFGAEMDYCLEKPVSYPGMLTIKLGRLKMCYMIRVIRTEARLYMNTIVEVAEEFTKCDRKVQSV